jgi:hypothetical protein
MIVNYKKSNEHQLANWCYLLLILSYKGWNCAHDKSYGFIPSNGVFPAALAEYLIR